jgi:hypothetical protein
LFCHAAKTFGIWQHKAAQLILNYFVHRSKNLQFAHKTTSMMMILEEIALKIAFSRFKLKNPGASS